MESSPFVLGFLLAIISTAIAQNDNDLELIQVQIVSRHGLRSPEFPYPNDAYSNQTKYWPNGWGQLTELGKKQEFELGQFIRKRYGTFFSETFSSKEVYGVSSDYERTILSAELVMAGLFNKDGFNIDSIIPTHSIPKAMDRMINPNPNCPRRLKLYNDFLQSNDVMKHYEDNKVLLDTIREKMGYGSNITTEMYNSIGSLMIYQIYNLSLPTWATDLLDSGDVQRIIFEEFRFLTGTDTLKRLTAGPILTSMVDNMKGIMDGSESRKLFLYMGHDMTISNLINTLSTFEGWPTFSATLFFELYQRISTQEYILRVSYKNSTKSENVRELELSKCPGPCAFQKFVSEYAHFLPTGDELDVECSLESHVGITLSTLDAVLIGVIVGLMLILLVFFFCIFCRSPNKAYAVNS